MSAPAPHPDAMEVAARILSGGSPRRAATLVPLADIVAMAARLEALDAIALLAAEHLAALSRERAAVMFAAPDVIAAHDALAQALAALGYVTLSPPTNEEQSNGQG